MAKVVEYDVSGVEEREGGGTGVKVPVGLRVARIDLAEFRDVKANGDPADDIRVGLNFGSEYDWGFTYIGLGAASDWKLAEFIRACGFKEKGKLNQAALDKLKGKMFVRVKVNAGTYDAGDGNGAQYSPNMGKLFPAQDGDKEAWEEGNSGASETSQRAAGPDLDDAAEPVAADGFYREGEPDPEDAESIVGSYDDWPDDDLDAEVSDRNLTLPGGRGSKKTKAIAALRADDDAWRNGGGGDEDAPAAAGGAASDDDYDEWDVDKLKQEWEERNFGDLPNIRGRGASERLKAEIIAELRKDDAENPFTG